jgi:hypothetical protein
MLKVSRKTWLVLTTVIASLFIVGVAWAASGSSTDTSISDFNSGTGCLVSPSAGDAGGDGEVVLELASGGMLETFSGSSLPGTWSSGTYEGSTPATVSGGQLTVNGDWASYNTQAGPPHVLEFVATYGPSRQHVGFGSSQNLSTAPYFWTLFSTQGGSELTTWTYDEPNQTSSGQGASYLGNPHRYRIEWTATAVDYYIDGVLAFESPHTSPQISANMYAVVSDRFEDFSSLVVDWMRMGPYNTSCTYTSRVFDKEDITSYWNDLASTPVLPDGTSATFQVRYGDTLIPGGTWTGFLTPAGGSASIRQRQYMQYEVTLTTSDVQFTPAVPAVTVSYGDTPTAVALQSLTGRSAGAEMGLVLPAALILAVTGYVILRKRRRISN